MPQLEFFYDVGSPWTYLAFHRIQETAERMQADLCWKPVLVGGVFNEVNQSVYEQRANPVPAKARYLAKDLQDWARYCGLEIRWPSVFPVNSVKAMRGALAALEQERCVPWSRACFELYWGEDRDLSQDEVLKEAAERAGLEPDALLARIAEDDIKKKLRDNTSDLIARGGFGSPTIFVGDSMFFGNDRLPLIEAALGQAAG